MIPVGRCSRSELYGPLQAGFLRFLSAPSCRSKVVIRLASPFKSELRALLLNSGDPQSSLDHFLNSDLRGSPKVTRAQRRGHITKFEQSLESVIMKDTAMNKLAGLLICTAPFFLVCVLVNRITAKAFRVFFHICYAVSGRNTKCVKIC